MFAAPARLVVGLGLALWASGALAQPAPATSAPGPGGLSTMFIGHPIDGSDPNGLQATLGRGFNTFTSTRVGNCVAARFFQPTMLGGETTTHIEVIKSEDALQRDTNLTVSGSSTFGSLSVSASGGYSSSVAISASSDYLLVGVVVTGNPAEAVEETLTDVALTNKADAHAFFQACGNRFISGVRLGGEFFALFQFTSSSETERTIVQANLKAASGLTTVSADLKVALQKAGAHSQLNVFFNRKGPNDALPKPDIDSIIAYAQEFPAKVTKETAAPIEVMLSDYKIIDPSLKTLDEAGDVRKLRAEISRISESIGQLRYLEEAYQRLLIPQVNAMAALRVDLEARSTALQDALQSCGEAPWDDCKIAADLIGFTPPKLPQLPIQVVLKSTTGDLQPVGAVESGNTCHLRISGRFRYKGDSDDTTDVAGQSFVVTKRLDGVQSPPKAFDPAQAIEGPVLVLVRIWDSNYSDNSDDGDILATLY